MVFHPPHKSNSFCVYQVAMELRGELAQRLARDFDFFTDRPQENLSPIFSLLLETQKGKSKIPPKAAAKVFSDCVMYQDKEREIFEYSSCTLEIQRGPYFTHANFFYEEAEDAEEIAYLFLQSELGKYLDKLGLHRVHALGLGLPNGTAALVLLPSGGGKSTLALELLKRDGIVLLSDDSPLVDRKGNLHPLPLRLSFRANAILPEEWEKIPFTRRKYGNKVLIPTSSLGAGQLPRPGESFTPGFFIVAKRWGEDREPEFSPLSFGEALKVFFRDLVVGLGIPQVAEIVLTKGLATMPSLIPNAASRSLAALSFLRKAKRLTWNMSRNPSVNSDFLIKSLIEMSQK